MADNISILDGAGATKVVATKDLSSVHFQKNIPYDELGQPYEEVSYRNIDVGTTGQVVKSSAGYLRSAEVFNQSPGNPLFLKIYDKATAATTGDTPVMTWTIPSGGQIVKTFPGLGRKFANGISIRASGLLADADATAPGTNEMVVNLGYK